MWLPPPFSSSDGEAQLLLVANRWCVPYWAAAAVTLLVTLLVNVRARGPVRDWLSRMLLCITAVLGDTGLVLAAGNAFTAAWAARWSQAVALWLAPVALRFGGELHGRRVRWLERAAWLSAILVSLLTLTTRWIIGGARRFPYGFAGVAGPLYLVALGAMSLINVLPILVLDALRREHRLRERRQLALLFASSVVGLLAFADALPVLGVDVPPFGWIPLMSSGVGLLAAILRYRFLDIRMAARRLLWWSANTLVGGVLFCIPVLLAARSLRSRLGDLIVLGAALVGMRVYARRAQPRLDRLVGRRQRDLDGEMAQLTHHAATLQTTEQLGRAVDRFLGALDRRLAALVVIDPTGRPRVALSAWGAVPAPARSSPLLAELRQLRALMARDHVRGTARIEIERACVRWGAELLGPLIDGDELLGIVAISAKIGGGLADALELEILERLRVTVTAALASARLYQRLRALSDELERKAEARSESLAQTLADLRGAEQRLVQSEKLAALGQIVGGVSADLADEVLRVHAGVAELRRHAEALHAAAAEAWARHPTLHCGPVEEMSRDLGSLLDALTEGARRAVAIAQDLTRFASSSDGETPALERAPHRLDELIDGTLKLCAGQLKQVTVVRSYDRSLPPIPVEAGPLGQVVLNLVLNATQAMRGVGTLTLSTRRIALDGSDSIELAVGDTGPGIAPEVLPRIFEPFFSTKGSSVGTGLGLSVSYSIVERHGGRMHVESALGGGSVFRVYLPLP